jgi:hypothetical protein
MQENIKGDLNMDLFLPADRPRTTPLETAIDLGLTSTSEERYFSKLQELKK